MRDYQYILKLSKRTGVKTSEIIRYIIKSGVEYLEKTEEKMKKKRIFTE